MVDSWLVAHALPPGITTTLHNLEEETETELSDNPDLCQLTAQKIQEEQQNSAQQKRKLCSSTSSFKQPQSE